MIVGFYYALEVATLLASIAFACALVARDQGRQLNRRMAVIPALLALWSLGELAWNLQVDAQRAEVLIRWTAVTWLMLGPACLHFYAEIVGRRHVVAWRCIPVSYLAVLAVFAVHVTTGLGLSRVFLVPWGYGFSLDASFIFLFAVMAAPIVYVLSSLRRLLPVDAAAPERNSWRGFYAAMFFACAFATATDIVLPNLGVTCPPLGSVAILSTGLGFAWQFDRRGHSLVAPSAFAAEILEALGEGVVVFRADGRIGDVNATFARMVGSGGAPLRGVPFSRFAPTLDVQPQHLDEDIECDLVHADGTTFPVSISPTWLRHSTGGRRGVVLLIRDLREVAALRGSLVASDRLAMVGGLSASISDEIREPIERVRSHLEGMRSRLETLRTLAARLPDDEKLDELVTDRDELLEECLEGVARVEAIVRDVRGFASGPTGPRERVDPNELIEDAMRIAVARAGSQVEVVRRLDELDRIECCPGEIVQVLVNLMVNAMHATHDGGRIELSSSRDTDEVWIGIEDDGSGIASEIVSRIFDPFFTTKPVGGGTGLGLAISLHIVHNHGGDLRVESVPGRGSRFTLVLPTDPARPVARGAVGG